MRRVAVGFGRMGHRDPLSRPRDWPLPMTFTAMSGLSGPPMGRVHTWGLKARTFAAAPDGLTSETAELGTCETSELPMMRPQRHRPGRPHRLGPAGENSGCFARGDPLPLRQCCRPQLAVGPGSPSHSILVGGELASVCVPPSTGRPRPHFHIRQLSLGFLDRCPLTSPVPIASLPGLPAIADTTASSCPEASVPACASHARHTSTLASAATTATPLRSATPWRDALTGSDMSRKAARP